MFRGIFSAMSTLLEVGRQAAAQGLERGQQVGAGGFRLGHGRCLAHLGSFLPLLDGLR